MPCVDRIEEGKIAVILTGKEDETVLNYPLEDLPEGIKAGDWLTDDLKAIDYEKTEQMRQSNRALLEKLLNREQKR